MSGNDEGVVYIKQTLLVNLSLFGLLGKDERGCIMQTLLVSLSLFGLLGKDEGVFYIMQTLLVSIYLVCWGKIKEVTLSRPCWSVYLWFVGER